MALVTPLSPTLYPRGTFVAAVGFIVVSLYYDHAWRRLKNSPPDAAEYPAAVIAHTSPTDEFVERDFLYRGLAISIFTFLLAGSADTPPTPLDHLVGALMGLCGAIFAAMFAIGLVSLWNLWRESIGRLKYWLHLKTLVRSNPEAQDIMTGSFLRAVPVAALWLAAGLAVLIGLGSFVGSLPHWLDGVF